MEMRIQFRHGLRLVGHPVIVDVFQAPLATEPRLPESFERVPSRVHPHLRETGSKPAVVQIVVHVWRTASCAEQQLFLPGHVPLQELRNVRV